MWSSTRNSRKHLLLTLYVMMIMTTNGQSLGKQTVFLVELEGGETEIPCNITAIPEDDIPTIVLWYKNNVTTPIYTLDARRGSLTQARHSSIYKVTRVYFVIDREPAILRFKSLKTSDQGSYRCRVDFSRVRTRYTDSVLKVIVPPQKPVIRDKFGKVLRSLIGPYNEGDSLVIFCEVVGGIPAPDVTWWRESVLLDDTFNKTEAGTVINELKIPALQRHDLMAAFSCQTHSYNITGSWTSTVTVDMNFRPLAVRIETEPSIFYAGKASKLECRTVGSRPAAVISWWLNDLELKSVKTTVSVDGNATLSVLTFKPSIVDNGKIMTCVAQNPLIPDYVLKEGRHLNVYFAPITSINSSGDLINPIVRNGHDVFFDCEIRANPWVTDFHWLFNDEELTSNKSVGVIISNYTLVLQKVDRSKRGRYVCKATNSEGSGESEPVYLRVEFAPICRPAQRHVYGTAIHETVKVLCEVEADPEEVTFRWMFNNSLGNREVLTFKDDMARSVATFIPQNQEDYGTLVCWGSNKVGMMKEPCFYNITPAGPPIKPVNCSVKNLTLDRVEVGCLKSYNGGLSQHFVLELYANNLQKVQKKLTSKKPEFLLERLSKDTKFRISIYAVNAKGRSETWTTDFNTLISFDETEGPNDEWFVEFSPVLVTTVAGVAGLVCVILVIIVVVKIRSRRNRKRVAGKTFFGVENRDESVTMKTSAEHYSPLSTVEDERGPDIIPANGNLVEVRNVDENETFVGDTVRWTSPLVGVHSQFHSLCEVSLGPDMELPLCSQQQNTFSPQVHLSSSQETTQDSGLNVKVLLSSPAIRRINPGRPEEKHILEGKNTEV